MGDAARSGALIDLKSEVLQSGQYVGRSLESYAYETGLWAMPIDAASQAAVVRPDLLPEPPRTLNEVTELAERGLVGLSLAVPHAFMTYLRVVFDRQAHCCAPDYDGARRQEYAIETPWVSRRRHPVKPAGAPSLRKCRRDKYLEKT